MGTSLVTTHWFTRSTSGRHDNGLVPEYVYKVGPERTIQVMGF